MPGASGNLMTSDLCESGEARATSKNYEVEGYVRSRQRTRKQRGRNCRSHYRRDPAARRNADSGGGRDLGAVSGMAAEAGSLGQPLAAVALIVLGVLAAGAGKAAEQI